MGDRSQYVDDLSGKWVTILGSQGCDFPSIVKVVVHAMGNPIIINIPTDSKGEEVNTKFFGGNLLFARDDVAEGSSFTQKVESLNIEFIRYPGGGVTNKFFDLTDPDKSWDDEARTGDILPLSDFVQYAQENDKAFALVLPVERYMKEIISGQKTKEDALSELNSFLVELNNGTYGELLPEVVEIGNEFYWNEFTGSRDGDARLYADVALDFAQAVRSELGNVVKIAVQVSPYAGPNAIVAQSFSQDPEVVDLLVVHDYPNKIQHIDVTHAQWMASVDAWGRAGVDAKIFLSEWNTATNRPAQSGDTIETAAIEQGIAGAIAMIELGANYIAEGVEYGAVWPLQQNTINDLGGNAGEFGDGKGSRLTENHLTMKGEVFKAMSESIVGKSVIDMNSQFDIDQINESARFKNELYIRAYEDENEVVLFVSAWNYTGESSINIDVGFTFNKFETKSFTVNNERYYKSNEKAVIYDNEFLLEGASSAIDLPISDKFEIIRITIEKPDPMLVGNDDDNELFGTANYDQMFGYAGDDILTGGIGQDTLSGGDGNDTAFGGEGDDLIDTGAGANYAHGGEGDDTFHLGAGENDIVHGGAGADVFIFDHDSKGSTHISDFNYTEDQLIIDPAMVVGVERMGFEWQIMTEQHEITVYDVYHHTTFDEFFDLLA